MRDDLTRSLKMLASFVIIIGVIYNGALHLIGAIFFPFQAKGSLIIDKDSNIKGSILLGQGFKSPKLFHTRVQHNSFFELYTPIYDEERIFDLKNNMKNLQEDFSSEVPMEIIASSGSNFDPFISVQAAKAQVYRVAKANNMSSQRLTELIDQYKEYNLKPFFTIDKINVVKLNIELQKMIN